jgi:hypothetical protein
MKNNENKTGNILSPDLHFSNVEMLKQVDNDNKYTIDKALKRLVDSTDFQFFEGKKTGNHYLVHIHETVGDPLSASRIETGYGLGRTINPKPPYQRPINQHPLKIQKGILMDFLCGERVGNVVLYRSKSLIDDMVDGGQRVSIVYNFMKDKLILNGAQASKFWAYYFPHISKGQEQNYDDELKLECNKIIKGLIVNKGIPVVKFSSLPHTIQQSIRELTFDVRRIQEIKFFCVETQQYITKDHPDYDDDKVIDMIRAKFNKLNLQQKPVQPIHTIWGSTSDYNLTSRKYIESGTELMSLLGYYMSTNENENDELMRLFNDIIVRTMLNYDCKISWGVGISKVAEGLLDGIYDPEIDMNSKRKVDEFLSKELKYVFSEIFVDVNNNERRLKLAKEIVGSSQKTIMQRLFILSLFYFKDFITENQKYRKYFDQSGNTTNRLFNFIELLSKIISVVSMRTIDIEEYSNEERPILKYGLSNMYKSNQTLFNNLMKLGGHTQKDNVILIPTLKEIVKLVDEYVM